MTEAEITTKAKSKRQRLHRKRERRTISLANGVSATAPIGQGQRPSAEDARKQALSARVRVFGMQGSDAMDDAKSHLCGSGVGMCIRAIIPKADQSAVWNTWQRLCSAQHNYRTRILGQSGNPQGSAIAMQSDAMQVDASHTIDIRSPSEKDESAKRAWAAAELSYKSLPSPQFIAAIRSALSDAVDGMGGGVWSDGSPTRRGRILVQALSALAAKP